jgi:transporter family protein
MSPFTSALCAALCWGFAPFFEKAGLQQTSNPTIGVFVRSFGVILGTACLIPFFPRLGPRIAELPARSIFYLCMGGILASVVGQAFFYHALKYGEISRSVAIGASYPVIACVLGLLIWKEPLTVSKTCGIVLVAAGISLLR